MYFLYKILNKVNQKVYIGQTNNFKNRWNSHKTESRRNKPKMIINHAMKKHGIENFEFEVIAQCQTIEDANELETLLIAQYDSFVDNGKGYNATITGNNSPMLESIKKKISQANIGKHYSPATEIKPGQRISPATEIKPGQRISPKTEFKLGQRISPKTEFKPGIEPHNKKFNVQQEQEIFEQFLAGKFTSNSLAKYHKVDYCVIKRIIDIKYNIYKYFIYKITNLLDNRIYYGQTLKPHLEWKRHVKLYKKRKFKCPLYNAMKKEGLNNFIYEVIDMNPKTQEQLDNVEKYYIIEFRANNPEIGFNYIELKEIKEIKEIKRVKRVKKIKEKKEIKDSKIKKGQRLSPKTEIQPGEHKSIKTEIQPGERKSIKTEFKPGHIPANKKLTAQQEQDIYNKYINGSGKKALAREFNIDRSSINRVINKYLTKVQNG